MFGANEIYGRKWFKENAPDKTLKVTSLFYTIQGEGPYSGWPAVFIRLSHCNLKCFGWRKNSGKIPYVSLPDGPKKKMSDLQIGEKILTLNEEGKLSTTEVVRIDYDNVDEWYSIRINGKYYFTTVTHPFFTNRGLISANELKIGDEIIHTTADDIRSFKMKHNNPMFHQKNIDSRLSNINYDEIGLKISKTIKNKQNKGIYQHPFSNLSNEKIKEIGEKISNKQMGINNSNYNAESTNRNFYDLKKKVKLNQYYCNRCNSSSNLEIHHIDHNRNNDSLQNLEILCKSCHSIEHKRWENFGREINAYNGFPVEEIKYYNRKNYPQSTRPDPLTIMSISCYPHQTYLADNMFVKNCSFCDTFFDDGEFYSIEEVYNMVKQSIKEYYNDRQPPNNIGIVITGGEPMLQQDNLIPLIQYMNETGEFSFIQIETNGTIKPTQEFLDEDIDIVVSPKCVEKNGKEVSYIKPSDELLDHAICLKFVVTSDSNSLYHTVPDFVKNFKGPVYISPMNIYNENPRNQKINKLFYNKDDIKTRSTIDEVISFWTPGLLNIEENRKNHEYAAKYCLDNGYRLQLQVHLYAGLA